MNSFLRKLPEGALHAADLSMIQVNVGLTCNMACAHCHVGAGPTRRESMDWPVMAQVLALAERAGCRFVDITGGAPEMNPHIARFVRELRARDIAVQVRSNLTIYTLPDYTPLARTFRDLGVGLVGSMPCYLQENVDRQRGAGAYSDSISALKYLNQMGFGVDGGGVLNLVYNPGGPTLPPPQAKLEADYKRELYDRYDVTFSNLLTIANMPIGRFRAELRRSGREADYWGLLEQAFNPATVAGLMCRHQVSVRWDGALFDCDFNLALNLPATPRALDEVDPAQLPGRAIATDAHCLGCTAGSGSSCGGALA
ncbi:arsenosugar biosynthesis radical SAM (seleno)protein ArsS [Magnetofaba australis]|uniref:Putative radical SAM protein n=1 Tax=Magnetofaba australis IT-1 TaxID=1434232 RepID=A0A1Y2JYX1_9PROT|nr:arsenosugar biosynthesis radical SAM (seleno)protein ArsS [Magnetofaba australis]OSM00097.1 putative radical SAM protein [Magnetofaba australis IT-1]